MVVALAEHATLLLLAAVFLFPLFHLLSRSLMTPAETISVPPTLWPSELRWSNYPEAWNSAPFGQFLVNSILVTTLTVVGATASAALCGFGFARLNFPGRNALFIIVIATLMLPDTVTLIPLYIIFRDLGWLNTFLPLTVPAFFGGGAISIFLFRQYFRTLPRELDEAAILDGANAWQIFRFIALPLSKPVIIAVATLTFLGSWTDLFGPIIFLNEQSKWTLAQGIASVFQAYYGRLEINHVAVISLVLVVPPLVLYALVQRQLIAGITPSGSGDRG
ncbi:MAG: carbohydrate ABC transporter permease [Chloroflexi bacterium]|nr:carbohydrate ABC transporter permease [Chloroflexota bacterium]